MEQNYTEQLERFSRLRTPEQKPGQANDTYEEICTIYCRIINLAKDILADHKSFNEQKRDEFIGLLVRANELNNEMLEGFVNKRR